MNKQVWSNWYPGLELKSSHLFALEDYLTERFRLMDPSYGVIDFNCETSISLHKDNDGVYSLIAKRIQGVTQGGYPVRLTHFDLIDFQMQEDTPFDIWVEVKVSDDGTDDKREENDKQQLQISKQDQFSIYSQRLNYLYLGRYQIDDEQLSLLEKPIPLSLSDLKPHGESWDKWCSPLTEAIQEFCKSLEHLAIRNIYAQVAFNELVALSIEWPVIPIVRLAHRLVRVERMARLIEDSNFSQIDLIRKYSWPQDNGEPVDTSTIPEMIADLLGELPINNGIYDLTGATVKTSRGERVFIEEKLEYGVDNQYRVKLQKGSIMVMNWYSSNDAQEIAQRIQKLINRNPGIQFIWPRDITNTRNLVGMGYIKPMLSENWVVFDQFITDQNLNFYMIATVALNLVMRFQELHNKELLVSRTDTRSLYVNRLSNEVKFSYEDNIVMEGEGQLIAHPEFVPSTDYSGNNIYQPGSCADQHFLAVLLFLLFMKENPFVRKSVMEKSDFNMDNDNVEPTDQPEFVFDSDNCSNEPNPYDQPEMSKYWYALPKTLREKFSSSFSTGLYKSQHNRVSEDEWMKIFSDLRDRVIYCLGCGRANFYDSEQLHGSDGNPGDCEKCKEALVLPPRLRIGEQVIMLNPDTQIYLHHHVQQKLFDFSQAIGRVEIVGKSESPHHLGLRNLSEKNWIIELGNNKTKEVYPQHRLNLQIESKITLGGINGEIRNRSLRAS